METGYVDLEKTATDESKVYKVYRTW